VTVDLRICQVMGWSYPELLALPAHLYLDVVKYVLEGPQR